MEGMFDLEIIGDGTAEGCTVGVSDGVTEGIFEMEMIGGGIAEGRALVSNDGASV